MKTHLFHTYELTKGASIARISSILLFASVSLKGADMYTLYASPNGSGTECSLASPGSISSVREKVRSLNTSMTGDIVVCLRGGLYNLDTTVTFDAADGGNNGFSVVYQSFPGEQALLSGGERIAGWSMHDAAKNIYKANVGPLAFRQIYINGKRAIRSRTPNLGDEKTFGPYHTALGNNPYVVNSSEVANWNNLNLVEFVWPSHWLHKRARLQSFTTDGATSTLSFMSPENDHTVLRDAFNQNDRPYYYWENAYEFLDAPGEWYSGNGTLYYIPRNGEDMSAVEVVVPKIVNLIKATGVSNMKIKGLAFKYSNWTDPSVSGYLNWQSGLANVPSNQDIPGMVHFQNSRNATIEGCFFENSGAHGLLLNGTVENNLVSRNQFRSLSSGGVYVVSDVCSYLTITDNLVDGTGRDYHDACGILVTCPSNTVIAHNEVRNTTYTGISIGWRWDQVDYGFNNNAVHHNLVHDFLGAQDDGGGIYTLGRMDNTSFHDNYIHSSYQSPYYAGWGLQGIYLDEGSTNKVIENNVLANVDGYSVTAKGANNQVRYNYYNIANTPSGTGVVPTGNVQVSGDNWPPEAKAIMDAAGIRYAGSPQSTSASWSGTGGGNWSAGGNWTGGAHANGKDQTATFSQANGGSIHQDFLGFVLGHMDFQNGNYSIDGESVLLQASGTPSLTVGAGCTASLANTLSGSGGLAKLGGGRLELNAASSYIGDTLVNGGTLALQGTYRSSAHTVAAGAAMELVVASGATDFLSTTFTGTGILRKTGVGAAIWGASTANFNLGAGALIDVQGGSLIAGSGGNENWSTNLADLHVASGASFSGVEANVRVNALSGSGGVSSGYNGAGYEGFTIGVNGGSGTFTGTITDGAASANLVKQGGGTQTLSGANTYTGNTTISSGVLEISPTGELYAGGPISTPVLTVASGATLRINDWFYGAPGSIGYLDFSRNLLVVNGGTIEYTGNSNDTASTGSGRNFTIGSGGATLKTTSSGQVWTLAANSVYDAGGGLINDYGLTLGGAGNGLIAKSISGTGALIKTDSGNWTLTAANSYTGATTVSGGTLALPNGDWVTGQPWNGSGATGAITVGSGATLSTSDGVTQIQNGLTLNGGTVSSRGIAHGTGNNTWGNLLLSSNIAAGNSALSTIFSEVRLTADCSMDVDIDSTLNISGGIALSVNYTGGINICGITKTGSGTLILSGANSYNGATTVSRGTLALQNTYGSSGFAISTGATLALDVASGTRDLASTTFSGTGTLRKAGAGDVIWGAGVATFALGADSLIDVQAGTFIGGSFGNENWTGNLSGLNVANGATFSGVEANVRVDALTGAGAISSGYGGAGYANFTFGVNNGSGTFSGSLTDGAAAGNFVKAGSGTQILTGTNTYTGTTAVNGGNLTVAGSLNNTSSVTIAVGATLEISGSLAATGNIVNNGTLILTGTPQMSAGGTITNNGTIINRSTTYTLPGNLVNTGTIHNRPAATSGLVASPGDALVSLTWNAVSGATSYSVKQSAFSGGPYTVVATPTTTNQGIAGLANGTTYYFVVSASNTAGEGANSAEVPATPGGLPLPWSTVDVGNVGLTGSVIHNAGNYTLNGAGAGVYASTDTFRYVYQTSSGDCDIRFRIQSMTNPSVSAKTGVMIRESLATNSRCAGIYVTPSSGIQFIWRITAGSMASISTKSGLVAPYWARMNRTGNTFKAYYSANGTSWTQLGAGKSISMATNAYIGTAVTSGTTSALCTAVLTNGSVVP